MPVALVTGALGGIGQAICTVLSARGYTVIGTDAHEGLCSTAYFIPCDLRDFDAGCALAREVRTVGGGHLDLLVNNAAYQVVKPTAELTRQDWEATLAINLTAPFLLTQAFLNELEAARGCVINVSSIHASLTKPGFAAYATSKGALLTLTRALAVDLGPRGIRVNAILPAATETPMLRDGFRANPEGLAELASMHPIGRIAHPEEIAEFIAFVASPAAGFITGSALAIDGGIGGRLHDPV